MVTRRKFFQGLLTALGLAALPLRSAWAKKMAIPLQKAPKLQKVGGWKVLKIKGQSILFVRQAEEKISALSSVCTHKGCQVDYNPGAKRVECPCHKSLFDLQGKVLGGPASKPLKTYPAEISDGSILITLD